jgi:hypothetical protein
MTSRLEGNGVSRKKDTNYNTAMLQLKFPAGNLLFTITSKPTLGLPSVYLEHFSLWVLQQTCSVKRWDNLIYLLFHGPNHEQFYICKYALLCLYYLIYFVMF